MAQLNPNFEIDFNDINSYEQIQLINDTQLAKENLLMHKAYKEPAEDEIIRNQFSSFTFVDFCPKLFNTNSRASGAFARLDHEQAGEHEPEVRGSKMLRYQNYELETFSDLFNRINAWLKLNKDWRVVSMETLIFDCTTQFNHLKSSIHSSHLPQNMRGLRLYLSPSKSRFSGPQKIGCINVVPRKLSGAYHKPEAGANQTQQPKFETLDQILARLNELLLTRPIEGRILSVETITLPMANGYVNTETNYFMDSRLNLLNQRIYTHANNFQQQQPAERHLGQAPPVSSAAQAQAQAAYLNIDQQAGLADVLRVYYEFGPMVCGLVNLLDFLPHFHLHQQQPQQPQMSKTMAVCEELLANSNSNSASSASSSNAEAAAGHEQAHEQPAGIELDASETLTRLVRRSLAWFEEERKRILALASGNERDPCEAKDHIHSQQINLKLCNLQIHRKVLLRSQLASITLQNVFETIQTSRMIHEPPREHIVCHECASSSSSHLIGEWCRHLHDLNEPFELKFVRLAYVVPVYNKHVASRMMSLTRPQTGPRSVGSVAHSDNMEKEKKVVRNGDTPLDNSSLESMSQAEASNSQLEQKLAAGGQLIDDEEQEKDGDDDGEEEEEEEEEGEGEEEDDDDDDDETSSSSPDDEEDDLADELHVLEGILGAKGELDVEELAKEASLAIVHETNQRQRASEEAHQLGEQEAELEPSCQGFSSTSALIGQLTYRLFAPCQLVNSSSCFSINPVNSSSPLSRRGSVNLNGSGGRRSNQSAGLSSENATPSTLLLPFSGSASAGSASLSESTTSINQQQQQQQSAAAAALTPPLGQQQQSISAFGAFFPALSNETIGTSPHFSLTGGSGGTEKGTSKGGGVGAHFTTNEFEAVEAIRRRMEIYVTTNSMKVLAGETLIVNLSDQLSCLSTAIEQTISKASFALNLEPSTWVSVYILYAAVDEPHLPSQLLEQQRLREKLALISEDDEEPAPPLPPPPSTSASDENSQQLGAELGTPTALETGQDNMVPVFDDDFKSDEPRAAPASTRAKSKGLKLKMPERDQAPSTPATSSADNKPLALNQADGSIRVELERELAAGCSVSLYNSAYDRTVALPTQPDNHLANYLEPVDFNLNPQQLADGRWLEGAPTEASNLENWNKQAPICLTSVSVQAAQRQMRLRLRQGGPARAGASQQKLEKRPSKSGKSKNRPKGKGSRGGERGQCSVM